MMDYKQIIKYWLKVWDRAVEYADALHWGYIGAGIFIVLFVAFLYESMASAQISLKFILALFLFTLVVYYFGAIFFGGMNGPPPVNN